MKDRPTIRRTMLTLFVILAGGYAAWLLLLYVAQDSMVFPRSFANGRYAPLPGDVETWRLEHTGGVVTEAMFVPARDRGAEASGPAPTIVLVHGNAMLMQDWIDWAYELSGAGWNVAVPEFRGYGASGGVPGREVLVGDLLALIARLRADQRVDGRRLVVYGRSIGGMIGAEASVQMNEPPAALVLHTVPASIAEFARRYGAPSFLVRHPFDAESAVQALRVAADGLCQITVIGHRQDAIVSISQTERLARAAGVEPLLVDGDHNVLASAEDERAVFRAIDSALDRVAGTPGATPR